MSAQNVHMLLLLLHSLVSDVGEIVLGGGVVGCGLVGGGVVGCGLVGGGVVGCGLVGGGVVGATPGQFMMIL
jgi:hypothetical protein